MSDATTTTNHQAQGESAIVISSKPVRGIIPSTLDEAARFADAVYKGAVSIPKGIGNAQGVFTIMQTGMEIGLTPMQALQGMNIINGKVGMSGDLMLALALDNPNCEYAYGDCDKADPNNWKGWFVSKRRGPYPEKRTEFTQADAVRAGLWNKKGRSGESTPWQTYPDRMLYYRAMGFNLRDNFPDAFKLLKSTEELRDYPDTEPQEDIRRSAPSPAPAARPAGTQKQTPSVDADFEDYQSSPSHPLPKDTPSDPHPFDELESRHQGTDRVMLDKVDGPVLDLFGLNKDVELNGIYKNVIVSGKHEPIDVAVPAEVLAKCVNGENEKSTLKAYRRKNGLSFTVQGFNNFIKELLIYEGNNPRPEDQAAAADAFDSSLNEEQFANLVREIEKIEVELNGLGTSAFANDASINLNRKKYLETTELYKAPNDKLLIYHDKLSNFLSNLQSASSD